MYENNPTPRRSITQKYARKNPLGTIFTVLIIVLLIVALVFCGLTVRKTREQVNTLSGKIDLQQNQMNSLSAEIQSAQSVNSQLTQDNAALQSDLQQKEQAVSSYAATASEYKTKAKKYKDKVDSYKNQLSEITSRYNDLAENSGPIDPEEIKKYATVGVTKKTCYLTFDDGPSDNTLRVLDILKEYNVKATFFVMNTSKLSYVKRIHKEGHTVALHTYSHDYGDIYRSQKAYFKDLEKIGKAVKKYTKEDAKVIRFPGGSSNTVSKDYSKGIMTALTKEVLEQGYVYFDWNVDSTDASGNNVSVSQILHNIKTYGGKNKQDVILMHDTNAKDTTVEALPEIIEYYIDKGYSFAPLTTSTPMVTHSVNN